MPHVDVRTGRGKGRQWASSGVGCFAKCSGQFPPLPWPQPSSSLLHLQAPSRVPTRLTRAQISMLTLALTHLTHTCLARPVIITSTHLYVQVRLHNIFILANGLQGALQQLRACTMHVKGRQVRQSLRAAPLRNGLWQRALQQLGACTMQEQGRRVRKDSARSPLCKECWRKVLLKRHNAASDRSHTLQHLHSSTQTHLSGALGTAPARLTRRCTCGPCPYRQAAARDSGTGHRGGLGR